MDPMRLTTPLEIKTLSNMQFDGHGAVFGNVDRGGDVILPGAFKRTLAEHQSEGTLPSMFWMHDPTRVPGKWLSMSEDETGLQTKGELAQTDLGKEVHTLLKMDAVKGLSIGYIPTQTDYSNDGVRLIKEVDLLEVSVVSIPMNPKAQIVHVKSRLSAIGEYVPRDDELAELKRECEHFLRNKGLSRKMARQLTTNLFINNETNGFVFPSETLEKTDKDLSETLEVSPNKSSETPDDIEVREGIAGFQERMQIYELEKAFSRIFPT